MSRRFTDGYFALGLILGISFASVLGLLISDYGAGCYLTDGNSYGYEAEGAGPDKRCWLIPFFVYGEDSLAQWLMAILTIFAVWMLWRTLELTRGANEAAVKAASAALEANNIMRGEQRPWITLERDLYCDFTDNGFGANIRWNYNFANKGKSPAFDVRFAKKVIRCGRFTHEESLVEEFVNECLERPEFFKTPLIFPEETTNFDRKRNFASFRYERKDIPEDDVRCHVPEAGMDFS
jgi:hypothetical protein